MFHTPAHKNVAAPAAQIIHALPATAAPQPDFAVSGSGTLYLLTPLTDAAREWVVEHVAPDAQQFGGGIAVEHRYIGDIVDGMEAAGLVRA